MKVYSSSLCDVGRIRQENQDCLIVDEKNHLYCISDGMGGLAYGKVSAEIVRDQLLAYIRLLIERKIEMNCEVIEKAIKKISTSIAQMGNVEYERTLYGATLTGILIQENHLILMNVGDSRVYCLKDNQLIQLTKDQTLVQYLLDTNRLTSQEAKTHPQKNVILQFMGKAGFISPQVEEIRLQPNDIYCICSDGLFEMIEEDRMKEIIASDDGLENKCRKLVNESNQSGGKDNISVILVEIKE